MRLFICLLLAVCGMGLFFAWNSHSVNESDGYNTQAFKHEYVIVHAHQLLGFNLVDPEQAPEDIRESVMRGYKLFMHTAFYAPEYCHNELSCTHCHFCGGDTLGGKNGGIALVGVTTTYPKFSQRSGKVLTLIDRMTNCFQRSMNGKAPAPDSSIMSDLSHYLSWISKEVESVKDIPWLGLPEIKNTHKPDAKEGEKLYALCCASCHRLDGAGGGFLEDIEGKTIPPLWGEKSFNNGAGMCTINMLAPFIYLNMPYQQAHLTEEEALDIAAYIVGQERPKYVPPQPQK
ncbi:MAG: c-type cytochrome [Parachlamydiaceae bacterium]